MAVYDYSDLLDRIDAVVYDNTTKDVTAERLKQLLIDILDSYPYMILYDPLREWGTGSFCVYDSGGGYKAYVCIAGTTGAFVSGDWSQVGV